MNLQVNINLCRVCMKSETGTSMLIDEVLQSKFEFVTHLRVKKSDNLPVIICEKCILLLNLSYKFIQSAQETENNLKTFLEKINSDFKLVTKTSPGKNDESDDVDGMLQLLGSTKVSQQANPPKITKELLFKVAANKSLNNMNNGKVQKIAKNCLQELPSVDETYSLEPFNSSTTDDDETRIPNDTNNKQLTHYIEISDDNSQIMEYKNLDEILVTEEENSQQDSEVKEEHIHKDGYFEEYETLLEDDTSTMDILYEENGNVFQANAIQQTSESALIVETIVVKVKSQNKNVIQEENAEKQSKEAEQSKTDLEKETTPASEKWSSRVSSMRKLNSSVAESTRFYCSKCNRDFSTKTNLTRHVQLHEGNRPYQCNICFKFFSQNGTLKQHMYIHTGEKPHVCTVCNRGFTQSKSLVFHMRRHTGYKPHQCDFCGSLFRQKDALKVHILKHHTDVGDRAFSCKICNKEMSGQELRSHMKKHLNNHKTTKVDSAEMIQTTDDNDLLEKPTILADDHHSDVDGSTHVIDIMATSTTEPSRAKKYQCRTCFKCFAIKKNLIRHLSFHDSQASSLQECPTCNLVFDTNYALKVHRVREHKETNINLNECDDCEEKFQNATELGIHMQYAHTFTCFQCPEMSFATKKHLNDHLLEHNIAEIEDER